MDMEVDETQFGTTKVTEEDKQKEYQRKRESGRQKAREAMARERIAWDEAQETRHKRENR